MKKDNLPENPDQQENLEALEDQKTPAGESPADETIGADEVEQFLDADDAPVAEKDSADEDTAGGEAMGADELEQFLEDDAAGENQQEEDTAEGKSKKGVKKDKKKKDNRRFRFGTMATALTAAAVAAVILFNVVVGILADRFPLNLDLTKGQTYSLSDTSLEIIKGVTENLKKSEDRKVEITVFADESIFRDNAANGDLGKIYRQYYEALNTCVSMSGGRITVQYVDSTDPQVATQYKKYDVTSGDTLLICGDKTQKFAYTNLYSSQAADYYGSSYTYTSLVEKTLMTKLNAVASDKNLIMTLFVGHGENESIVSGLTSIYENNGYEIKQVDLSTAAEIDENTSIAVIPAPSKDYSKEELQRLRDWMDEDGLKGHNLMVLVDYAADCPELYGYLKEYYGIEVTDNLVMETDMNKIASMYLGSYYSYVDVEDEDLTAGLSGGKVILGPTRQLLTHWGNESDSAKVNYDLLTYSESAKLIALKDALKSEEDDTSSADSSGEEEKDKSFAADEYPVIGMAHAQTYSFDSDNNQVENNVLVCGGMMLAESSFLSNAAFANEDVLLNSVNTITGNEDAIVISGKSVQSDSLTLTQSAAMTMMVIFVIAIPVLTLVICLVVFIKRRHL